MVSFSSLNLDADFCDEKPEKAADGVGSKCDPRRGGEATSGAQELQHHVGSGPGKSGLRAEPLPRRVRRARRK